MRSDFYTTLLDWKYSKWGGPDDWLIEPGPADQPGITGGLLPRQGPAPLEKQAVNAFVCTVQVTGLDALVTQALDLGATLALPKMPIPGMGWLAYIKDPDGNLLGLMEPDEKAA